MYDNKSLNTRVKFIDSISNKIYNFLLNDIILKSENKALFIAFCFEFNRFIDFMNNPNEDKFYTYLPIQLDATCNGYQHLALLTKDNKNLYKLNLNAADGNTVPSDFYNSILVKVVYLIRYFLFR